jgi:hypothetical protein
MLSINPRQRPTILEILNKSFVKKYVVAFIQEELKNYEISQDADEATFNYLSVGLH